MDDDPAGWNISTHALREEGDVSQPSAGSQRILKFLPTPSARRATKPRQRGKLAGEISTHALREEGDILNQIFDVWCEISTHALREEGDLDIYRP